MKKKKYKRITKEIEKIMNVGDCIVISEYEATCIYNLNSYGEETDFKIGAVYKIELSYYEKLGFQHICAKIQRKDKDDNDYMSNSIRFTSYDEEYFNKRFCTTAQWRDKQIETILND